MTEPIPELPGQTTIDYLLGATMNDAFSAAERNHLTEPEFGCRRCGRPVTVWDDLCAPCEDDAHDYAKDAAYEREERAAARGREYT